MNLTRLLNDESETNLRKLAVILEVNSTVTAILDFDDGNQRELIIASNKAGDSIYQRQSLIINLIQKRIPTIEDWDESYLLWILYI